MIHDGYASIHDGYASISETALVIHDGYASILIPKPPKVTSLTELALEETLHPEETSEMESLWW